MESNVAIKAKAAELACVTSDMVRSLKKWHPHTGQRCECSGPWNKSAAAKCGTGSRSIRLVRPGLIHALFAFQPLSRRQRGWFIFAGARPRDWLRAVLRRWLWILSHHLEGNRRTLSEISQIGEEIKLLAPALKDTKVVSNVCILYSDENEWALSQPMQPNNFFSLREHVQLFYNAPHSRNFQVDFARPGEDFVATIQNRVCAVDAQS